MRFSVFSCFVVMISIVWLPHKATADNLMGHADAVSASTIRIWETKIKLWGIQVPKQGTEENAMIAKELRALLAEGNPVLCVDSTDRSASVIVARCLDSSGRDIGEELIRRGHAKERRDHTRNKYAPFPKLWRAYADAEEQAGS